MSKRSSRDNSVESERSYEGATITSDRSAALFSKRKFRLYREFTTNTNIKFVATKNFFLTSQRLWTGKGAARMVVATGGTEGGTFTPMSTVFSLNTVGTPAVSATAVTVGGTHTGGTEREVLRADSGTNGGGAGNGDLVGNNRYLTAGTYYFDLVVTGTTDGMLVIEWEEEA